jgi:predicted dinucleotide-binding enzyme
MTTIGVLHPGEMGTALAASLRERGHDVRWAGEGRSAATRERAAAAGLRVSDSEVTASWGVTGIADPDVSAAREARGVALQLELDQVLTVLAHRRARLVTALRASADTLAHHAEELRR